MHTYTLRAEAPFLVRDIRGTTLSMEQELRQLLDAGIDGYFIDFPDRGAAVRDAHR